MALNIGDNFKYQGKKPNFERDSFATKAEMKGFPEANVDEGHISFCEEDGKHYEFKAGNSVDTNTGKWREFTTNVDLSGYATKTEVQQSVANKVDKSYVDGKVDVKQDKLADGINIKTINGQPIMGKGNITIAGPDGQLDLSGYATKTEMLNNITDYNVSKHHPTEGIGGTNKFTLESAIKLIPESLRSVGIKCSFLDESGEQESWRYNGPFFKKSYFSKIKDGDDIGDLFFIHESINKDSDGVVLGGMYYSTPFILIDKEKDIEVQGYAMASSTSTKVSALNFYNSKYQYIGYADRDSQTPEDTTGIKEFVLSRSNIPVDAVYMRACYSTENQTNHYLRNGDITVDQVVSPLVDKVNTLSSDNASVQERVGDIETNKMEIGNIFMLNERLDKDGKSTKAPYFYSTPFVLIDKNNSISVKGSASPSLYSPLNFYDEKLQFISWTDNAAGTQNGTGGVKDFVLPKNKIPSNAVYMRAGYNRQNFTDARLLNGKMSIARIIGYNFNQHHEYGTQILDLTNRVSKLETPNQSSNSAIDVMAEKYDMYVAKREMYLRNLYQYDKKKYGKWYGVTWKEEDNPDNVTDISSAGDESMCNELPIQNKMRRCVVKDGILQYYLDADNSELKEDKTQAKLDGTDGNVMVEIPEFFYKFEVSEELGVRTVKLMIAEYGIDGFNFSPKHYVGAYYATLNRQANILATVCTTKFTRSEVELKTEGEDSYIEGDTYSLGVQKLAVRNGFTENAATYRGGHQYTKQKVRDPNNLSTEVPAEFWDNSNDTSENTFCLNKLGVAVAQVQRSECREQSRMWLGETMYLYDTQKALWILSSVEFKTRNIQKPINKITPREGGLGWGATVYPNYEAYEAFFAYRGTACIPNGVTNNLGNHSGEVYYRMYKVPVEFGGNLDAPVFSRYADVLIPVMSYRGVENFYGHMYSTADQVTVKCVFLDGENRRVDYYYQKNPFRCKTDISNYEYLGQFNFEATIKSTSQILMGFDGHILPIKTSNSYDKGYCDCSEISYAMEQGVPQSLSFNGRLVSKKLVGRNFLVSFWRDDERANRASESVRQCQFIFS